MKKIIISILSLLISFTFHSYWFPSNSNPQRNISSITNNTFDCYENIFLLLTNSSPSITKEIDRLKNRISKHQLERLDASSVLNNTDIFKAFVRDPNELITDPEYLLNYIHVIESSTLNHFIPWLLEKSNLDFADLIINQQEYLIKNGVMGFYFGEKNDQILTGSFRPSNLDRVMYSIERSELSDFPTKQTYVQIDNIPKEISPWFRKGIMKTEEHLFRYQYPDPSFIEAYIEQMELLMKSIRDDLQTIISKGSITLQEKEQILTNLAKYYQLGMCAHVFERINNSLFMSHVNTILHVINLKSISHGNLDFVALTRDTDNFVEYFLNYIKIKNHN